jgi:hypothetical protein
MAGERGDAAVNPAQDFGEGDLPRAEISRREVRGSLKLPLVNSARRIDDPLVWNARRQALGDPF